MDGLECNELLISTIRNNGWFRLDSHYYEKHYLELKERLSNMPHWFLRDMVSKPIQTGHTPSMKIGAYYGGKVAFIKTDNLHANHISDSFSDFLSEKGNAEIARTSLQEFDIITTIIGASEEVIARSAIISTEHLPANINQNIVQIRIKKDVAFPEYVNTYLNTKYGRDYLRYLSRQTEQVNLNCKEVESVIVPKFSFRFQNLIATNLRKANKLQQEANFLYVAAGQSLAEKIGNVPVAKTNFSIKSFSKSFRATGRLDADYYQPRYEEYIESLHTKDTVSFLCNRIYDDNFLPRAKEKYKYIELANVGMYGNVSDLKLQNGDELPSRARRRVKAGQVIVSSIEGSLQSCALITDELDGALCSTGFYVIDSNRINSETLLVLFKSEPIQALMKQRCSGTILTAISKNEFLSMPLPEIDSETQNKIAEKVQKAFALRKDAEQLISIAVRTVEIAIEENETAAMIWVEKQIDEINMED